MNEMLMEDEPLQEIFEENPSLWRELNKNSKNGAKKMSLFYKSCMWKEKISK